MIAFDSFRLRRLAKEGGWIIIGQIASVSGALVLVRVLTEYLSPVQYGQLALGLTMAGLVNQVVMGGITAGIGRFYSIAVEKHDLDSYLFATKNLLIYAVVAVIAIGLVLEAGLFWLGYFRWMMLAAAVILFSVLKGLDSIFSSIQNSARQRAVVAFHGGLDAWLKIALAVVLMLWLGNSSAMVVIGYGSALLVVNISQWFFLRRIASFDKTHAANSQSWRIQMWAYAWPFSLWGIFTWMQQASDRWALQSFVSTADVGKYSVLFQLGYTPISIVTGMAMSFLVPILYQRSGDARDHQRNQNVHQLGWKITYISLAITLICFAITLILHKWLFSFLVAAEYRKISWLLPWFILAGGIFASGQMLALKLMSEMKPVAMTSAKIITALMGILLNICGAAYAGIDGVVVALVTFSCIHFIWMSILARRLPLITV